MSLYSIPPLVTALLFGFLGFYIFLKRRGAPGNLGYIMWCYFTFHWQFCWAIAFSVRSQSVAETVARIGYSGIVFLPVAFYHFAVSFALKTNRSLKIQIPYFLGALFVAVVWSGHYFINGVYKFSWGYYAKAGNFHPIFLLFLAYLCVDGLYMLSRELKAETSLNRKTQLKYVLLASFVYMFASTDFGANYGISVYPFGFVFTLLSLSLIVYAITKHRLMEVSLVIRNTLVYSLITLVLGAIMMLVAMIFAQFAADYLGHKTLYASTVAACLITVIFHPLQRRIQSLVDRYFFRDWSERGEMLREVAAGFSHELKSPLAGLSMQAQLTLSELEQIEKNPQAFQQALPRIKEELHYMVNKAMDAARRIEAVRGVAEPSKGQIESVNVSEVLENSLSALQSLINDVDARIQRGLPRTLSPVRSNAKQLEIVFINLMKNALEAMDGQDAEAVLSLSGVENQNSVKVSIKDTGSGIAASEIGRLFDPYYTTKGRKGTGMGLFLSQQIIKAHGGAIDVVSEEGKGTEFIVVLPKYTLEGTVAA